MVAIRSEWNNCFTAHGVVKRARERLLHRTGHDREIQTHWIWRVFLCGMAACILVDIDRRDRFAFPGFPDSPEFIRAGCWDHVFGDARFFARNWLRHIDGSDELVSSPISQSPPPGSPSRFRSGRFPGRGIVRPAPYYRWGAIWGAILVGATTGIASYFMASMTLSSGLGGSVAGAAIGAVAGVICGAIFRGIVRPAEQVKRIQVDVF